ncbi:nitrate reductase [Leptolyngbya sp. FACHB-16]|uniref:molybdopterin oxidoreductase family protein n=1 Tax=unclassified Leptolyngbya TaxID=2650499 RepID=UPI0016859581|nr:nitrate reductase [Leptolyngbya sp. FACHB-16]MBD2156194.1 nitrate reductase [Leptolyngbya sp. FACHB-16]
MSESTKTLCPYCGVGCGLEVVPTGSPTVKVRGDRNHPSSQGMVCVKGATIAEALDKDRLLYPMLRNSLDEPFQRVSWDEALNRIVQEIQRVRQTLGADGICMYGSGQFQTEDYYVAQKLMKGCLGTNNFDANSRLCMSSAVAGYIQSLGSDGPPCCYDDLEQTDHAFLIGTNTAECHPIIFNRLQKYHKRNPAMKLVVVDPRRTPTAEAADLHLAIRPGTDIDLLHGIAYLLMEWGAIAQSFIQNHTNGFEEYAQVTHHYTPDVVAVRCGIAREDLETAARWWAESARSLSLWSMGLNQYSEGTAKIRTLINLHLMTGTIGKPGCGPFSLTGQPNAMGGREAGGLASLLPGYRSVKNSVDRAEVEAFWGLPGGQIAPEPGRDVSSMVRGLEQDEVGLLWIAATNPAVSLPDLERTKKALQRSPFTVYQDAYYPTETSAYAHLLLPAAQWGEKTGTMTNSERMVTLCQSYRPAPGEARADWAIFAEVGRRLGFEQYFQFQTSAEVRCEFAALTQGRVCDQSGITHETLKHGPIQWPQAEGTEQEKRSSSTGHSPKRLYTDHKFPTPDGRARFAAYHSRGLAEPPDENFPMVLTNGRLYGHWHTLTRTGRIEKTRLMHPQPFLEIHPKDARRQDIEDGQWVEVRSRRGMACLKAKVTEAIAPGTVFMPMHWGTLWADQAEVNTLTHPAVCPESLEPELKACAVQLVPITLQGDSEEIESDFLIQEATLDQAAPALSH